MSLTVRADAKINLWLDITGRLPDGYHSLNTVMRSIDLYDDVTVETNGSGEVSVSCDVPLIPTDERNIAFKAAKTFFAHVGKNMGANVHIVKRIPVEAGLGGSSADGAAVLTALNELCGKPFGMHELCGIGASLGADVPFCIMGGTAKCTGIGDIMEPLGCAEFAVLVVKPDFSCNTGKAYRSYDASPIAEKPGFNAFCDSLRGSCSGFASNMYNIFEELYGDERIDRIKTQLLGSGALGACMSGSGSAVFGVFGSLSEAERAARSIDIKTKFAVKAI